MTLPNLENKFPNTQSLLIECRCNDHEYAEFIYDKEDKTLDLLYIGHNLPFWYKLKNFFSRKWTYQEIILDHKDIKKLSEFLNKLIK